MPEIRAQVGPQEKFLSSPADIAIFGGAAGGGKTMALLLEACRNVHVSGYNAIIFRRTYPQIFAAGGLWDTSQTIYRALSGRAREAKIDWNFPSGASINFRHMQHEKNKLDHQGAQYAFIGFDELTHFEGSMFWYLMSRLRSTCGVRPYVRCTCNPDPDSFVSDLISWWIDQDTGLPIPERSGVLRYFARRGNSIIWGDCPEEVVLQSDDIEMSDVRSFTFIASRVQDNQILLNTNPEYLANLKSLCLVDRERLLEGNWLIRPTAGSIYRGDWFEVLDDVPATTRTIRYWDRAATVPTAQNPDPDYTSGTKLSRTSNGLIIVEHSVKLRTTPAGVQDAIRNYATQDGEDCIVILEKDPAQAGKAEMHYLLKELQGLTVRWVPCGNQNKVMKSKAASAECEHGRVKLVRGIWNRWFINDLEAFPEAKHDDTADSFAGGINVLLGRARPRARVV